MNSLDSHPRLPPSSAAPVFRSTTEIFETAAKRCFSVSELIHLLSPATPLAISFRPPSTPPPSGALFLYDRSANRNFKQDGHDWVKKRVSLRRTSLKVREDDVRLRLDGEFRVAGWYARLATKKTFRRRTYNLINPQTLKALNDLVLVHYLDTPEALGLNSKKPCLIPAAADEHERGESASASFSDFGSKIETKVAGGSADGPRSKSQALFGVSGIGQRSAQSNRKHDETSKGLSSAQVALQGFTHIADEMGSSESGTPGYKCEQPQETSSGNFIVASASGTGDTSCNEGGTRCEISSFRELCTTDGLKTGPGLSDFQTYPKLSEHDVAKEWASSSEGEKCAAIADLYGSAVVNSVPPASNGIGTTNLFATQVRREVEILKMSILEEEINAMQPDDKSSFLEAVRRCPHLAWSDDIKLQFLRCEDESPQRAALRLVNYWSMRVELFGIDLAFAPLTLQHTLANEWEEATFGFARLLPGTDASGRAIIFADNDIRSGGMADLRSIWYMAHAALEDDGAKKNGVVYIHFNTPSVQHADRKTQLDIIRLIHLLPIPLRGLHVCRCVRKDWFRPVSDAVKASMGKHLRARRVLHEGSIECLLLRLSEFGISQQQLPSQIGGAWTEDDFRQWLESRFAAGR